MSNRKGSVMVLLLVPIFSLNVNSETSVTSRLASQENFISEASKSPVDKATVSVANRNIPEIVHIMNDIIIMNQATGLVWEAREDQVKLQELPSKEPLPSQLWTFEITQTGIYFIVNQGNRNVLDIQDGSNNISQNLVTLPKHGNISQQWEWQSDGTVNSKAKVNFVVDIKGGVSNPGTSLVIYPKHGGPSQTFDLIFHNKMIGSGDFIHY